MKERQDILWNELSDSEKQNWENMYKTARHYDVRKAIEDTYGFHNLNPKKTYAAISDELFNGKPCYYIADGGGIIKSNGEKYTAFQSEGYCTSNTQAKKLLAINKLLNVAAWMGTKNAVVVCMSPDFSVKAEDILGKEVMKLVNTSNY